MRLLDFGYWLVASVSSSALFGCKIKNLLQIASVAGLNLKLSKY